MADIGFGIDLGTTRTSIGMVAPDDTSRGWYGNPIAIPVAGATVTPSAILFSADGHVVGTAAKRSGHAVKNCAQLFKREMDNAQWHFTPECRPGQSYSAEDLSALMLEYVAQGAAAYTGLDVQNVVVTVPAYFGEPERRRTRDAAHKAGLTVLDVINEPTAALLAYLFAQGVQPQDMCVLVFDFGGGTFDTVVVNIVGHQVTVASINGDTELGGHDLDSTIANHLNSEFKAKYPTAELPLADEASAARLMLDIEDHRQSLSDLPTTNITVFGSGASGGSYITVELTRQHLETILKGLLDEAVSIAGTALQEAQANGATATHVLFVGGATKTPAIKRELLAMHSLHELTVGVEPDLMVTYGAAIWAQKLMLERTFLTALGAATISEVDWDAVSTQQAVNDLARQHQLPRDRVVRMLRLDLRSISSRGYALLCSDDTTGERYLEYLVEAGTPLPLKTAPRTFKWAGDTDSWRLRIYEDVADKRGSKKVSDAKLVEILKHQLSANRTKGDQFEVEMELGRDQILHVAARHLNDVGGTDVLDVEIRPQ